jgi:hypothetical protein
MTGPLSHPSHEGLVARLTIAAYALSRGGSADEAEILWYILQPQEIPTDVFDIAQQLEAAWAEVVLSRHS